MTAAAAIGAALVIGVGAALAYGTIVHRVASAPAAPGANYVVVEKHYLEIDTHDDTNNWFYGTVRNDGSTEGNCNVIAYYFDEDDRAIGTSVVAIKPLTPGQLTTFRTRPTVQNVASAAVAFTGGCGHGKLWHYTP
ncbi:MAG TPA: FxLYD domain-containing protein [bacterium]|nr:FxLYD domain-containing protein [bacterium]